MFWPLILSERIRIEFAHTSFKWKNLATKNAGVTVVIVCLSRPTSDKQKLLTESSNGEPLAALVENINAYLVAGTSTYVEPQSSAPADRPTMYWGNKPTDGGFLIMSTSEARELMRAHPEVKRFLKLYYGSTEFIKGSPRVCIWVSDGEVGEAEKIPALIDRFESVRKFRAASKAKETRPAAEYPHRFRQIQGFPGTPAIVVPIHTSESRDFLPVGFLDERAIISNAAYALYDAEPWEFIGNSLKNPPCLDLHRLRKDKDRFPIFQHARLEYVSATKAHRKEQD